MRGIVLVVGLDDLAEDVAVLALGILLDLDLGEKLDAV